MSAAHSDQATGSVQDAAREESAVRTPFYFRSGGQSLFAWWHRGTGPRLAHGVVICPPIGHEQVHSHRALRHLAQALALEGFDVLRFDYHSTGDSEGTDEIVERCGTWQANVRDAVAWMRSEAGCRKISLIGLRMGASLAARYAAQDEVDYLVLWAPIVSGRRYVRELTALNLASQQAAAADSTDLEAAGFVYHRDTLQELTEVDLLSQIPRCQRGLLVPGSTIPKASPLFEHLSNSCPSFEQVAYPGYDDMMAEPHRTEIPQEAIKGIVTWMREGNETNEEAVAAHDPVCAASASMGGSSGITESVRQISITPDLFGIASEPIASSKRLPWIVLLNAGSAYRIGPGRLHVRLARHFAALGHPCLRVDICGLGDSVMNPTELENDSYAGTAFRDVAIILDYLQRHDPGCSMVLMGLCSGAYVAFQSAAQMSHPALVESVLINPLTYFWKDGMTIDDAPADRMRAWHYYWKAARDLEGWRKLLSGKTQMGIKGTVTRFLRQVMPSRSKRPGPEQSSSSTSSQTYCSHPAKEDLPADLDRIRAAPRRLAMFVSESDPGYFLLMGRARRKAKQMIREGKLKCFFISDADHTFSTESARIALIRAIDGYLKSRFDS